MEKIKKTSRERASGLLLLVFAVFIVVEISAGSHKAESKNEQGLADENQTSGEIQILGEANENLEEIIPDSANTDASLEEKEISKEKAVADPKADAYNNLKSSLKKYCGKSGSDNRKKCKKYCSETKNKSSHKDLYKKYCNEEDSKEEKTSASVVSTALTLDFIINSGSGTDKFTMEFKEGETVYELMKEAKLAGKMTYEKSADETYGVYINEINGQKEGSDSDWTKNKYWILYVSGKSSSLGCSSHKLTKSDSSIEWKYERYSF